MSVHSRPYGRALLALVTLLASLVLSAVPVGSATLSAGVVGGFEQDGNETLEGILDSQNNPATLDWKTADDLGTVTVVEDDTADSGFTQGSKELDPDGWVCGTGGADPGKANILAAFVNPRVSATDIFLDLAFIRELGDESGGKGDVHLNFEFNQADVDEPGEFAPGPCGIDRRVGDLLITYDYPGGSDAPTIEVYRWAASKGGEWVNNVITADKVAGAVNDAPIEDTVGGYGTLARQRFGEASLDLEDILQPESGDPECISFGSVNVRSRSSGESITSMLQDKLPSWPVDFSTCGSIDLIKKGNGGELLAGAKFQLYLDKNADNTLDNGDTKVGSECTTDAQGICDWDDLNPGVYFVKETAAPDGYSIHLPAGGVYGPIDLEFRESVSLEAAFVNFKWLYRLNLTPDATNLVGTDHVFTATLDVKKTAGGDWEAASGETLDIELSGEVGSIVSPGEQCTTDSDGECDIKIHSEDPGDSVLYVSFDDKVTSLPVDADDEAVKHWVDYFIDIAPDATNRVGTSHIFTVTLERDSGSGPEPVSGAHPVVGKVSGPGEFSDDTCQSAGTDSNGQCTIKLTSAEVGTSVVEAIYEAAEEQVNNSFSDRATKHWVDFDLIVEPDGVNHAGDPHTFSVRLLERVNGEWTGLAGETVSLDWDGTGSIAPSTSCVTDDGGECEVVASSDVTGSGRLTAGWDRLVDSGLVELSDSADKTWIDWDISIAPDGKTNLVGSDHGFTVTVRYDAGDGGGLLPLAGATPDIAIAGAGSLKDTDCDEGTAADGTCGAVITSAAPGDSTVTASWEAVHASSGVSEDLSASAVKHWVDYRLVVEEDAVNLVGDEHVFTVTLTKDSGAGFGSLAGAQVALDWSGGAGSSVDADSCVTDAAGQCEVTVTSSASLTGTLTASFKVTLDSGTHTFTADSQKRWVNWALSVTPEQAENLVDTNHTFTVKVSRDEGTGAGMVPLAGAKPTISLAGKGSVVASTCDAGTDAAGLCTVTITSSEPGLSTVKATFSATEDQASISLSASGQKRWVDYRITVTPETAVNPVGTTHTFDVKLEKNIGDGFVVAGSEAVSLGLTGVGSITAVDAGTIGSDGGAVCATDAAGTCRVTITSSEAGLDTLQASYAAKVGETSRTYTDSGEKNWVAVLGAVELPRTGAALAGQAWLALSLMGTGVALQLAGRRRRGKMPTG